MKFAAWETEKMGRVSHAPAEALRATGDKGAEFRVEIARASTPRKKAVRRMAPRLPGSSYFWWNIS